MAARTSPPATSSRGNSGELGPVFPPRPALDGVADHVHRAPGTSLSASTRGHPADLLLALLGGELGDERRGDRALSDHRFELLGQPRSAATLGAGSIVGNARVLSLDLHQYMIWVIYACVNLYFGELAITSPMYSMIEASSIPWEGFAQPSSL